jgi:hypothetical protein
MPCWRGVFGNFVVNFVAGVASRISCANLRGSRHIGELCKRKTGWFWPIVLLLWLGKPRWVYGGIASQGARIAPKTWTQAVAAYAPHTQKALFTRENGSLRHGEADGCRAGCRGWHRRTNAAH